MLQFIALGDIKDINEGRELIRRHEKYIEYYPEENEKFNENYLKFCAVL